MRVRKIPHPGWNLDYLMFLFTRVSGVSIILLAFIGLVAAFLMNGRTLLDVSAFSRWTFFPNPNHVMAKVPDVQLGWANGFWQIMQMLIVLFGVTHGFNGLRVVLEDYVKGSITHYVLRIILFLLWIFMIIVAFYVIQGS